MNPYSLIFVSLILLVGLLVLLYQFRLLKKKHTALLIRVNNETLDYHIKAIDTLGYDVHIKPKKKK